MYVCVHQTKPALSKPTIAAVSAFIAHGTNYAKCGDADKTTYYNYKQKKCLVSSMHSLAVGGFTGVLVSFSCAHIGAAPATLATWKGRSTSDVLVLMHVDGVEMHAKPVVLSANQTPIASLTLWFCRTVTHGTRVDAYVCQQCFVHLCQHRNIPLALGSCTKACVLDTPL